ncbi:MAG: metallophosphoesterase [Pyrinomonadaceae bacterium]|nr:metallophosphoesterase [Pyrinomonadaceae bacterium]
MLGKAGKIVNAIRNLEHDLAACLVVVSGDSTFSGSEEQYWAVLGLLQELKESLTSYLKTDVQVRFIVVPGNHDCDFGAANEVREKLVGAVEREPEEVPSESLVRECTAVQDSFFEYKDLLDEDQKAKGNRLYYEYHFEVGGRKILFRCYNTAWLSRLHESQGELLYPVDAAAGKAAGFELTVTVFHHPYNWLQHENARVFRKHAENVSDIILTGHEHEQTRHARVGAEGERNLYIEGGVLQETGDESVSTFNALVLDLEQEEGKQKFFHFSWNGEMYVPVAGSSEEWEDLQVNKLLERRDFEVSEGFGRFLEDPGVQLSHPAKGNLPLSDVFVAPDLREITHEDRDDVPRLVKGADVLDTVLERRKLMLLGADKSGKTSLAKVLFSRLRARGLVPVLIDGSTFRVRTDRVSEDVGKVFEDQYSPRARDKFEQLGRSQKVILVDDFDRLNLRNLMVRETFLRALADVADGLILMANDQAQHMRELMGGEAAVGSLAGLPRYEVQELGHVLREELIGRWLSLADDQAMGAAELARKLNNAHVVLNTLIGRNFVPSYPVFILSVLQALEFGTPVDTNASTYGYFYELFIKNSLAETSNRSEYDVKTAYLSFLAYRLFVERIAEPTLEDLRGLHEEYERVYALSLPFETLLENLKNANILDTVAGAYRFKYKYIHYYFVASYVKDYVSEEEVRARISDMSEKIYVEENANILLFLAHLVKDQFAIGEMLSKAEKVFGGYTPAKLEKDAQIFDRGAIGSVSYRESAVAASRKAELQRIDESEEVARASEVSNGAEPWDSEDEIFEIDVAMKSVQILGQMLKNFPGSLRGDLKARLTKECYELGLRTLAAMFEAIKEAREELVADTTEYLKANHPGLTLRELEEMAIQNVVRFAQMTSYTVVKHVSHSVGSGALVQTYKRVLEENGSDAAHLIDLSIKLDHEADFPTVDTLRVGRQLKQNDFALSLLRYLVVNHFYMFHVVFPTRQSVCASLGISYEKATRITNRELRKLEGPR